MLIDTHCHLNYPGLVEDVDGVVERAHAAGVDTMVSIATKRHEWDAVIAGADRHAGVWATVGVHPHEADTHPDTDTARLVDAASHPRVVGIGESGLDYFYDRSDREAQRRAFRAHIAAARETGLPLIVHTRDAEEDTAAILREEMAAGAYTGVIHCFTASAAFAKAALELGLYISLSGIVTFKNARDLQAVATELPEDRLLVETDAPFLAPVPVRGKVCEPAFVAHTARFVAALRGTSPEALAATTRANSLALFGKVSA
jgi:TatD DNase family protein